jgi:cell division transport system permease protein
MIAMRSDLPLRGDTSGRFVLWLVMVLVFMAALAVTVNAYVGALLTNWEQNVSGTLTIQIPSADNRDFESSATVARIVDAVARHPAVSKVSAVPRAKVIELLKPWLGEGEAITDLPLPALVDVELRTADSGSIASVSAAIKAAAPSAVVDDHRVWLGRVIGLARGFAIIAVAVMAMVTGALGLTIVFATRASLTEFAQVIEILHVVGAKDGYVAGQFARRALEQGFLGGLAGLLIYAPALGLVSWLAARVDAEILPAVTLPIVHWLALAALPVAAGVLAMVTANFTVRRSLATKV